MTSDNTGHVAHGSPDAQDTHGHDHDMQNGSSHHFDPADTSGIHGMLVFGEQQIYLSHLPMFMFDPTKTHEHNFQVLMEVTFTSEEDQGDLQSRYVDDRKASGEKVYTLEPERFRLTDLIQRDPQDREKMLLRSFKANLYRGHFERGGTEIFSDVIVTVQDVIYWHEFDPDEKPSSELLYLLFGRREESFLAHRITRPPDFDQILSVTFDISDGLSPDLVDRFAFGQGDAKRISFGGRSNTISDRLKPGEQTKDFFVFQTPHQIWSGATLTVGTEFYFEEGELRLPATFQQTEEEKRSGF